MRESRPHCKMIQAAIVEVLHQVGFERASARALSVLVDLALASLNKRLNYLREEVSSVELTGRGHCIPLPLADEEGPDEMDDDAMKRAIAEEEAGRERGARELSVILQCILIEEYAGPVGSYRREELVSFLQYQVNVTRQLREREERFGDSGGSLLEILRLGDVPEGKTEEYRGVIDFGGEMEDKREMEEKKHVDPDVREYLEEEATLPPSKLVSEKVRRAIGEATGGKEVRLDTRSVEIYEDRRDFLKKEESRDYEYLINQKRLCMKYIGYYEGGCETPLLDDLVVLSSARKIKAEDEAR